MHCALLPRMLIVWLWALPPILQASKWFFWPSTTRQWKDLTTSIYSMRSGTLRRAFPRGSHQEEQYKSRFR